MNGSTSINISNSNEMKLIKGLAKSARDFLQEAHNILESYLSPDSTSLPESAPTAFPASSPASHRASPDKSAHSRKMPRGWRSDPTRPKRPLNSFLLYCRYRRDQLRSQGMLGKFRDGHFATLAEEWAKLSESEKNAWIEKAKTAKDSHEVAMEEYLKNKTDFEDLAPQEKEPETDKEDEGPIFKLIPDADPETNTEPMAEDNNAKGKLNEDPGQAPMTEMTAEGGTNVPEAAAAKVA